MTWADTLEDTEDRLTDTIAAAVVAAAVVVVVVMVVVSGYCGR
jgi:hypothetical protein